MTLAKRSANREHDQAVSAVQRRLLGAANLLRVVADSAEPMYRQMLRYLAVELRAIGVSMEVLRR